MGKHFGIKIADQYFQQFCNFKLFSSAIQYVIMVKSGHFVS